MKGQSEVGRVKKWNTSKNTDIVREVRREHLSTFWRMSAVI